ncbi:MAG: hypothetical protein WCL18_10770 [bacterium]
MKDSKDLEKGFDLEKKGFESNVDSDAPKGAKIYRGIDSSKSGKRYKVYEMNDGSYHRQLIKAESSRDLSAKTHPETDNPKERKMTGHSSYNYSYSDNHDDFYHDNKTDKWKAKDKKTGDVRNINSAIKREESAEVSRGAKVESEHKSTIDFVKSHPKTSDKEVQERIAKDHLKEDDRYYEKLAKQEKTRPTKEKSEKKTVNDVVNADVIAYNKSHPDSKYDDYGHKKTHSEDDKHVATEKERKKNPYLSADSIVHSPVEKEKDGKNYDKLAKQEKTKPTKESGEKKKNDYIDNLIKYEEGDMSREEENKFLQEVHNRGDDKTLQGNYGREIAYRKQTGEIKEAKKGNEISARELELHGDNARDVQSYRDSAIRNMVRKKENGTYDHDKAVKQFELESNVVAKSYDKDYNSRDEQSKTFDKQTRRLYAEERAKEFEREYELGNYDNEHYRSKKFMKSQDKKKVEMTTGSQHKIIAEPFHKEDTEMQLDTRTAILVPSTKNTEKGSKRVSQKEYDARVNETRKFMATKYGGYTSVNTTGGYVNNDGKVIKEPVTEVVAYTTKEDYEKNKPAVDNYLDSKQKSWKQESMGYEYQDDAHLYYYKKKE